MHDRHAIQRQHPTCEQAKISVLKATCPAAAFVHTRLQSKRQSRLPPSVSLSLPPCPLPWSPPSPLSMPSHLSLHFLDVSSLFLGCEQVEDDRTLRSKSGSLFELVGPRLAESEPRVSRYELVLRHIELCTGPMDKAAAQSRGGLSRWEAAMFAHGWPANWCLFHPRCPATMTQVHTGRP